MVADLEPNKLLSVKVRNLLIIFAPIHWIFQGIARVLTKFDKTKNFGFQLISAGDLSKAITATKNKRYKKGYDLYRRIIERGGKTLPEAMASENIAWFYENGVVVEKNLPFAQEMRNHAKTIYDEQESNT